MSEISRLRSIQQMLLKGAARHGKQILLNHSIIAQLKDPRHVHEICTALELLHAGPWRPIDTAPKDGTMVDLWFGHHQFPKRETDCHWGRPDHSCGEAGRYCDSCPDYDGWCANDGFTGYLTGRDGHYQKGPTHWMPKPGPPPPSP